MKRHLSLDATIQQLAFAFCFLIPLRLSLAYIVLIPAITLWLLKRWLISADSSRSSFRESLYNPFVFPLIRFTSIAALSALCGVDPGRSLLGLLRFAYFTLAIPLIMEVAKDHSPQKILKILLLGQSTSAIYTVLRAILPSLPRLFIGDVSASGQLAMTVVIFIGLCIFSRPFKEETGRGFLFLIIPTIIAFIINLKRGPWLGAFFGLACLFILRRPKLVTPLIIISFCIALSWPSVRDRLAQSGPHFFIRGGRSEMWSIAGDIVTRFPLGVGYRNSAVLQQFSTEIPKELRHFHNNFINLIAETGWISTSAFIGWLILLLTNSFHRREESAQSILANVIGAAIISNQVAGLVEYNFGDSEVVLILYILVGCLDAVQLSSHPSQRYDVHLN